MKIIQAGFTLMELMITLAIIGILASIAIPLYQDYLVRAQITEAFSLLSGQKQMMVELYASQGKCPSNQNNPQDAQLVVKISGKPTDFAGKYVQEIRIGTTPNAGWGSRCGAYAIFKNTGVASVLRGQWVALVYETGLVKDNQTPGGTTSSLGQGAGSYFACYVSNQMVAQRATIKDCDVGSTQLINN